MTTSDVTLDVICRYRADRRGDRWAAIWTDTGITVYGQTSEEAMAKLDAATDKVFAHIGELGRDAAVEYLDKHGIPYFEPKPRSAVRARIKPIKESEGYRSQKTLVLA